MKRKVGVKGKLLLSFFAFSIFILAILWLLEIVFLGDVYRAIKIRFVKDAAEEMKYMKESSYQSYIVKIAGSSGICASIYDSNMNLIASEHSGGQCVAHNISSNTVKLFYDFTKEVEGKEFQGYLPAEEISAMLRKSEWSYEKFLRFFRFDRDAEAFYYLQNDMHDCVFYSMITENEEGEGRFVLLSSVIIPVESTIETIRFELALVSVVLILVSLLMAFILSRTISKPIVELNRASKTLPSGVFDSSGIGGYREVEELSTTLNAAAEEISKTDHLRRELISNVSHDLRTPLTLIAGYSEAMRDLPGENSPENLQVIIDESQHLSELVSDLLDLSKLEAGIATSVFESIDFVLLCKEIVERYRRMTVLKGFDFSLESNCDSVKVMVDRVKITQVIYNLIHNAINYSHQEKKVLLRILSTEDQVRLEVIDHGVGIPEEKLKYIWDRYYRVDRNHQSARVGSGLGLSIVKKILELHHAWFGVDSKLGEGSCFWFVLPRE